MGGLHIDRLDAITCQELAARWAAPSSRPAALEQFLLRPIEVARRLELLSEVARDALVSLVEAAATTVPSAAIPHEAVAELYDAALVTVDDEQVHLCDAVAKAALDELAATPCRLALLLHGQSGADRDALVARLRDVTGLALEGIDGISTALTETEALGLLLRHIDRGGRQQLEALVERGGCQDKDDPAHAELLGLGLVWETEYDYRIPAEVLRTLLRIQLTERTARVRRRWRQLLAGCGSDNLHLLPINVEPVLAEVLTQCQGDLAATGIRCRALKSEEQFRELTGLHDPSFPAATLASRLMALGPNSYVSARTVVQALTEHFILGLDDPPSSLQRLFSPDLDDLADGCEDDCWGVLSPQMLGEFDELCTPPGTSQGLLLLRLVSQQILASLPPGSIAPVAEMTLLLESVASVARCAARLVAQPYLREPRPLPTCDARRAVCEWLASWPAALGWVRPEIPPDDGVGNGTGEYAPVTIGRTVTLFGPGTPGWDDVAHTPSTGVNALVRPPVSNAPFDTVRVAARADHADRLTDAVLSQWSPRTVEVLDTIVRYDPQAQGHREPAMTLAPRTRFSQQLAAFTRDRELLSPATVLLESFLTTMPRVRGLCEVTAHDLARFLSGFAPSRTLHWPRHDIHRAFIMLDELVMFCAEKGITFPSVDGLRDRYEGPWLRTHSATQALQMYRTEAPPPNLLTSRPEHAHDGLAVVTQLRPDVGAVTLRTLDDTAQSLEVLADPRPCFLLRQGDHIDGQLIRFGEFCWWVTIRGVSPSRPMHG